MCAGKHSCSYIHGIGKRKFELIKAHFTSSGLTPCMHGNTGPAPANTLIMEEVRNVVVFVTQHAEANAILLPGRILGYKGSDIQFRRTFISSLLYMVDDVNTSADVSVGQLVGTPDGEVVVPTYDFPDVLGTSDCCKATHFRIIS